MQIRWRSKGVSFFYGNLTAANRQLFWLALKKGKESNHKYDQRQKRSCNGGGGCFFDPCEPCEWSCALKVTVHNALSFIAEISFECYFMAVGESLVYFQAFDRYFSFATVVTTIPVNICSLWKHWDAYWSYVDSTLLKLHVFYSCLNRYILRWNRPAHSSGIRFLFFTRSAQRGIPIFVQDIWIVEHVATNFSSVESLALKI